MVKLWLAGGNEYVERPVILSYINFRVDLDASNSHMWIMSDRPANQGLYGVLRETHSDDIGQPVGCIKYKGGMYPLLVPLKNMVSYFMESLSERSCGVSVEDVQRVPEAYRLEISRNESSNDTLGDVVDRITWQFLH